MKEELDHLAAVMRRFADDELQGSSPLYERLARAAAEDPSLLEPLLAAPRAQRRATLYFAAIHSLVLEESSDELAGFFPDISSDTTKGDPVSALRAFLAAHDEELRALYATRNTQTNEVGRSAFLIPMLGVVAARAGRPLAIIEAGASAGLNLLFDRYFVGYGTAGSVGDPSSRVRLTPAVRGATPPPVPHQMPAVASRLGIDLQPVDVRDDAAVAWLRACIWPEHADRLALFSAAVEVARAQPPPLLAGDVLELLPAAIADASPEAAVCVFHTAALAYLSKEERARFGGLMAEADRNREVFWVAAEGPRILDALFPEAEVPDRSDGYGLVLGRPGAGRCVGAAAYHGRWIEWS